MKDRLAKLGNLTRGAALVGIGIGAVACTNESGAPPPATGTSSAAAAAPSAAASAADPATNVPAVRRRFPIPNAIRRPADLAPATDAGAGSPPNAPDAS
jgi:hypothetical protein